MHELIIFERLSVFGWRFIYMSSLKKYALDMDWSHGRLVVWHADEPHRKLKKAWEKKQVLEHLNDLGFEGHATHEVGYPYFPGRPEKLSLSHRKGWFAIYLSDCFEGIDIELPNDNFPSTSAYFLNDQERHFTAMDDLRVIWSAKEAIYKKYLGIPELRNSVTVEEINHSEGWVRTNYQSNQDLLRIVYVGELIVVYSISEAG